MVFVSNAPAMRFIMCVISILIKADKFSAVQECEGPSALDSLIPAHCSGLKVLGFFFAIHLLECAIKEKAFTWTPHLTLSMN